MVETEYICTAYKSLNQIHSSTSSAILFQNVSFLKNSYTNEIRFYEMIWLRLFIYIVHIKVSTRFIVYYQPLFWIKMWPPKKTNLNKFCIHKSIFLTWHRYLALTLIKSLNIRQMLKNMFYEENIFHKINSLFIGLLKKILDTLWDMV